MILQQIIKLLGEGGGYLDIEGFDPSTSRMLSVRSTN